MSPDHPPLALRVATVALSLAVTSLGLTSQALKNRARKSVEGLSPFYFSLLAVSYTFWSAYGFVQRDLVLVIPMTLGAAVSWLVVSQFAVYRKKRPDRAL